MNRMIAEHQAGRPAGQRRAAGLCALAMLMLLSGCGSKVLQSTPSARRPEPAPSKPSASCRIPATQRPYTIDGKTYYPLPSAEGYCETGTASWYGAPFHGRKTSNGETYNMYDWTAAHKTLPMNTRLLVENLENGRQTTVRVNDRGPFVGDRIIDLSYNVARDLGIVKNGTGQVRITALGEAETVRVAGGGTEARFLPHADFQQGEFFVQIGAFTVKENADRLKERMIAEGRRADTYRYDRGDGVFFRVHVYAGTTLDEAKQAAMALSPTFPGAFVVAH